MNTHKTTIPVFQHIKNSILESIQTGVWRQGEAIPPELTLAKQFGVSRMTVNRALRELTAEHVLTRVQGSGTFVAQQKYQTTLIEIQSIAKEIRARGHVHRSELYELSKAKAGETLAFEFSVSPTDYLFHTVIVHFENGEPIQVEDRWVNPAIAPEYLQQDFSTTTPNEYLMANAPLQSGQYTIEALPAPEHIAEMLHMQPAEACLVLQRTTHSMNQVAPRGALSVFGGNLNAPLRAIRLLKNPSPMWGRGWGEGSLRSLSAIGQGIAPRIIYCRFTIATHPHPTNHNRAPLAPKPHKRAGG